MLPPAYRPLAAFAAPARERSELWRTMAGLVLIAGLYWVALVGGLRLVQAVLGDLAFVHVLSAIGRAATPGGMAMLLATFAPMAVAVAFVTRVLHRRAAGTLFGAGATAAAVRVGVPLLALMLALFPLALMDGNVGRSTPLGTALMWLPVALPLLAVQIGAEEMVFRGYLLQQMAARSQAPLMWMGLPSLLFGALHYAPETYGSMALWPVVWAVLFGCLAADLTARTGNLGAALALHFANNFSAMFLVGLYGEMDGLALFTVVINPRDPAMLMPYLATDAGMVLVSWLTARVLLRV
ncbi:CPBP family intramembrane glutamic endopeptidase [Paenirhodobacter sp.]|uniref:CPBP family intramembrane glutamic endopeptidase n=1 Tax=Paenirhodobacter sp. TaxID=1965326 RepID=UPI003B3DEE67